MKKIIPIVCVIVICAMLVACMPVEADASTGYNRSFFDLTYNFTEAIVFRADGEDHVKVKSWCDYENSDMIQITLEDGTTYLTHSTNIILISPAN
jgi:hypothetical protein